MQILRETKLEAYEKAKKIGAEAILDLLEKKNLVGRGGGAYPVHKKWRTSKNFNAEKKYLICNADEGEPGTFKDKFIIKNNPETLIEGIIIAANTIGAEEAFIYLRGEYEFLREHLQNAINNVLEKTNDKTKITIVRGAGAYICGESTAIIQSIMGERGHPTYKPPHPTTHGLWNMPTVVNNVETLTCVAQAILYNDWNSELRLFSLSGNITNPGLYELPLGVKMKTLIDIARPKNKLKAMSFGCFGGIMPVNEDSIVDESIIEEHGCHHGAFTIIFIDETQNVVDIVYSIAKFYTYESCGKCTPCREGTIRLLNLVKKVRDGKATNEDFELMDEFAKHVQETSLCGLGQTSGNHIITSLQHFREDYESYGNKH